MSKTRKLFLLAIVLLNLIALNISAQTSGFSSVNHKIIGMYIHQHWSYNHPYAARTWTLEDWRGYLDGLSHLGFNAILIWPMLETMPDPLTPSDEANLKKIAEVINIAHRVFNMKVSIVLCPNVSPRGNEGSKYTFEKRPFFHTDARVDPGDPVAFGKLMAWRERLFRPLAQADGLTIIDSDPGGYPNSTNLEFVYLLGAHRRMLDRLRPGIEIDYWANFGWESYCKFYATGELNRGNPSEICQAITLMAKQKLEPWGVASGYGPGIADSIAMADRVISYNYGAIEGEPSFPFTLFGGDRAYNAGKNGGQRGVMGNAQTHCVQLPNTFAFARGAQGLPVETKDYIDFANQLIPGQGNLIVESWEALQGEDVNRMNKCVKQLASLKPDLLKAGPLKGLLFGDPARFINDLILQLRAVGALYDLRAAVNSSAKKDIVKTKFAAFIGAAEAWQGKHGYSNCWGWAAMQETLAKLKSKQLDATLATLTWVSDEGETPFDKVKNGLSRLEDYTPRLIASMKIALREMDN
jgi:hypothetical protein